MRSRDAADGMFSFFQSEVHSENFRDNVRILKQPKRDISGLGRPDLPRLDDGKEGLRGREQSLIRLI